MSENDNENLDDFGLDLAAELGEQTDAPSNAPAKEKAKEKEAGGKSGLRVRTPSSPGAPLPPIGGDDSALSGPGTSLTDFLARAQAKHKSAKKQVGSASAAPPMTSGDAASTPEADPAAAAPGGPTGEAASHVAPPAELSDPAAALGGAWQGDNSSALSAGFAANAPPGASYAGVPPEAPLPGGSVPGAPAYGFPQGSAAWPGQAAQGGGFDPSASGVSYPGFAGAMEHGTDDTTEADVGLPGAGDAHAGARPRLASPIQAYRLAAATTWQWFRTRSILVQVFVSAVVLAVTGAVALLAMSLQERQETPAKSENLVQHVIEDARLRAGPGEGETNPEVDTLRRGEPVTVLETQGAFSVVRDSIGLVGYIRSSALAAAAPPITPVQPFPRCTRRKTEMGSLQCEQRAEQQAAACVAACAGANGTPQCPAACRTRQTECVTACREPVHTAEPTTAKPTAPGLTPDTDAEETAAAPSDEAAEDSTASKKRRRKRKARRKKKTKQKRRKRAHGAGLPEASSPDDFPIPLPEDE